MGLVPFKETPKELPTAFCPVRNSHKTAIYKPGSGPSPDTKSSSTLTLWSPASRTKNLMLFRPSSLWIFVKQPSRTKTYGKKCSKRGFFKASIQLSLLVLSHKNFKSRKRYKFYFQQYRIELHFVNPPHQYFNLLIWMQLLPFIQFIQQMSAAHLYLPHSAKQQGLKDKDVVPVLGRGKSIPGTCNVRNP